MALLYWIGDIHLLSFHLLLFDRETRWENGKDRVVSTLSQEEEHCDEMMEDIVGGDAGEVELLSKILHPSEDHLVCF